MGGTSLAARSLPAPNRLILCVLVCASVWVSSPEAAQFDYTLGYRAWHSDNVTRIPDEREAQSELINTVSAGFSYLQNTNTISARVLASAAYDYYSNDTFENQTNYSLDAYGEAFIVQRTLSWVVADGYRRLLIDPLTPDTPTNRENSNAWATGPNVYLRFGPVDIVTLEGRYGRAWVENNDIDNDRYAHAARWAHRMSARSTVSLNYEYLYLDYENNNLNTDVLRQNYFVRTSILDTRNEFIVDLGGTKIEREGYETVSDWLMRLTGSMQSTTISRVGLRYRREYSDTGGELLYSTAPTLPSTGPSLPSLGASIVTGEPFYLQETDLFYTRSGAVLPWTMRAFYRDIDYEISPSDRLEKGLLLDMRYLYSSTVSLQLFTSYTIFSYDQTLREDRDSEIGITLAYRMTPTLQAGLDIRRFGRTSTAPDQDYTDDRFGLTLMYSSRPAGG